MRDLSWMLSAGAIKAARTCNQVLKSEMGITLSLADPKFLEHLDEYVEMSESEALKEAHSMFLAFSVSDDDSAPKRKSFFSRA